MMAAPRSIRRRLGVSLPGIGLLAGGLVFFGCAPPVSASDDPADSVAASWEADAGVPGRLAEPVLLTPITFGSADDRAGEGSQTPAVGPLADLRVTGFVAAVLAAVVFLKWGARRSMRPLPSEVFAVLGEAPLGGQHTARIVRFGSKTILVGVSGATCTPLAEIDDAAATERISLACGRSSAPAGPTAADDRRVAAPPRSAVPCVAATEPVIGAKGGT